MELYQATTRDRPGVHYQCTVSMAPPPSPVGWAKALVNLTRPWGVLSTTVFAALWGITSRYDERYPCAAPAAGEQAEAALARAFGRAPGVRANDGVVPLRSQLRGRVAWAGYADHLDVLGHFEGGPHAGPGPRHVDWLKSGAGFDAERFAAMTHAIVDGMTGAAR
jgi:hypothetical protein